MEALSGPLAGIRVVDMSLMLLGPSSTKVLAELGADVVKVEPKAGDGRRALGPSRHASMPSQYLHINHGKRSIALDVKSAEGRQVVLDLCRGADVFIHNSRREAMQRLRLAYDDIAAVNAGIVYCAAVGFGKGGAYADKPALDDMIQGLTAIPSLQKRLTGQAVYAPFNLADRICGMIFTQTILAAMVCRARTGQGQSVEMPMFEAMADFVASEHLWGHTFVPPAGELGAARQFDRRPLATKDGHICFWIGSGAQSVRLFDAIGQPELQRDPRFKSRADINRNLADFYTVVEAALATRTTAEWMTLLEAADIPVMPLHTLESMLQDRHLKEVGFFKVRRHPTEGDIMTTSVPTDWSKTRPHNPRHAPGLGEHGIEILLEAGYTQEAAADLVERGIVQAPPHQ